MWHCLDVEEEPSEGKEENGSSSKFLLSQDCVEHVVSPIILRLNFSLVGDSASSRNLRPVLAVGSQDHVTASVSSCPVESPGTGWLHCVSLCLRTHNISQSPTRDGTPKDARPAS